VRTEVCAPACLRDMYINLGDEVEPGDPFDHPERRIAQRCQGSNIAGRAYSIAIRAS
jgi:hypothetical protein